MTMNVLRTEITDANRHNYPRFQFSELTHELYCIQLDQIASLAIVGDPANGSYEWMIRTRGNVEQHSDAGYGDPAIAMRDGLIAFYGLPEE